LGPAWVDATGSYGDDLAYKAPHRGRLEIVTSAIIIHAARHAPQLLRLWGGWRFLRVILTYTVS
jgi:hypothetical protein